MYETMQEYLGGAREVLIVGGGPSGVTFAGEIRSRFETANVVLVHSGAALMSRHALKPEFVTAVHERLVEMGVTVMLQENVLHKPRQCPNGKLSMLPREGEYKAPAPTLALPKNYATPEERRFKFPAEQRLGFEVGHQMVRTKSGKHLECDVLIYCTGESFDDTMFVDPAVAEPWAGAISERGVHVNEFMGVAEYPVRGACAIPRGALTAAAAHARSTSSRPGTAPMSGRRCTPCGMRMRTQRCACRSGAARACGCLLRACVACACVWAFRLCAGGGAHGRVHTRTLRRRSRRSVWSATSSRASRACRRRRSRCRRAPPWSSRSGARAARRSCHTACCWATAS
jgi:hypothetical protein